MGLIDLRCTNCGASLPAAPATQDGVVRCAYCGHVFQAEPVAPPPRVPTPTPEIPRVVVHVQPPRAARPRARRSPLGGLISALVLAAIAIFFAKRAQQTVTIDAPIPSGLALPKLHLPGERVLWDDVGGPPQIVSEGGHEAFVGRFRIGAKDELFVVATDATSMAERWRVGPLGTYGEAYQTTRFAVAGPRVVVTDFRDRVHVVDAATGREERAVAITDRAKQVCALSGGAQAWVQLEDGQDVTIDLASGATKRAPRPSGCPEQPPTARLHVDRNGATGISAPKVAGFKSEKILAEPGDAVSVGVKSPGTRLPIVVGFEPGATSARWQQSLEPGDPASVQPADHLVADLAGGRLIVAYDTASHPPRLVAFDARSGTRAWDVELPRQKGIARADDLVATKGRAYVVRSNNVEVFDAASGKLVGRVGSAWLEE